MLTMLVSGGEMKTCFRVGVFRKTIWPERQWKIHSNLKLMNKNGWWCVGREGQRRHDYCDSVIAFSLHISMERSKLLSGHGSLCKINNNRRKQTKRSQCSATMMLCGVVDGKENERRCRWQIEVKRYAINWHISADPLFTRY